MTKTSDIPITYSVAIDHLCLVMAADLFALFSNQNNRGPNFKWSGFVKMVTDLTMNQYQLSLPIPEKYKKAVENLIPIKVEYYAKRLMDQAEIYYH